MIKPLVWLTLSFLLAACAQTPRFGTSACSAPASQSTLLSISRSDTPKSSVQRLVLYTRTQGDKVAFVGVDTIGSPLFSAGLQNGELNVNSQPLYRGADPARLLWGYLWWQGRERLTARCAASVGYKLKGGGQRLGLSRSGKLQWQWRAKHADTFELTPQHLRVKVRVLSQ